MSRIWNTLGSPISSGEPIKWKEYEKTAFRFFFIYFFLQAVPLDWKFYRDLFSINWFNLHYADLFQLAHYSPQLFDGPQSYFNWISIGAIAIIGTIVWTILDKKSTEYNLLYYWLRVILRYRLAIGFFAFGFLKFFPLLSPYPSISNLNTNYGDFSDWKLFALSLGIVPDYQSFLGFVELLFAFLLLFRKTTTIGAFGIFAFAGNIFMSNLAYTGGEHVYSLLLLSFAVFLLAFDLPRLVSLFGLGKPTEPNKFNPVFSESWQRYTRIGLQALTIFLFVGVYGVKTYAAYNKDPYHYPSAKGIEGTEGLYNVSLFKVNKDTLDYSATDARRWKDVVFEKWATISVRSGRPVVLDSNNVEKITIADKDRAYELEGTAGRHYYSYKLDPATQLLTLKNRNKHYEGEQLTLKLNRPSASQIILSGLDENKDSIYVVLDKRDKKYLLEEVKKTGRRKSIKL